jgi:hypothetical protein
MNYNLESDNHLVANKFKPSKCAQNSLNFISKSDEEMLVDIDICDDIYDMVKIIYLLLGIPIEPKELCIKKLYKKIMPLYGINTLSKII